MRPESSNLKDSHAIALECKIIASWERIWYVVREAYTMPFRQTSVNFEWIRYIAHSSRCTWDGTVYRE